MALLSQNPALNIIIITCILLEFFHKIRVHVYRKIYSLGLLGKCNKGGTNQEVDNRTTRQMLWSAAKWK